ncbi:MAG: hypothetical protein II623_13220, partial [Paludibacteraceae bacterium]|nr:hypothetical protein [Paludibacteraceae bacterium]
MKTILRYLLALIVVLNIGWTTKTSAATIYPIELTAQLLPPYSNCLGNYMSGEMDRVNIMALMKDITLDASNKPLSFDIQLHMTVRQGSQVYLEAQTRANNPITFSLQRDGVIKRLENAGRLLAPGVAEIKYAKFKENGYCLPEGGYEFVFQAFDNNNPTLKLSAPVSFYVYLNENEPPMLVSPINSACVSNKLGVVNFMWMERSVPMISSSKKFHLVIKEVPEGATDLEMAFNNGQEVFSDDNIPGTLTMKNVPVTAGRFQTGRMYVWKIRAFDNQTPTSANAENNNAYKNNGWSELGVFRYDHCLDNEPIEIEEEEKECDDKSANPTIIYVDENGNAPGTVYWIVETPADSFRVEYTLASDKIGFWTKSSVATNDARKGIIEENVLQPDLVEKYNGKSYYTFPIGSLDKGKEYLVRVSSVKNKKDKNQKNELDSNGNTIVDCHSKADSATFKLPKIGIGAENEEEEECRSEVPQLLCQEDCVPENAPKKGDYISANGVNVKVLSISQSKTANGHTYYSGEGVTYLPFLDNVVGAYMQFTDIRISCANELLEGKIVTVYREDANFSLDLNEILNDNFTGTGPAPQQETFAEAKTTEEIETGRAAFVEEDGKQNLYTKSPDGTVVYVGEKAQCDEYNENDLDDGAGLVMFSRMANDKLTPFDYNAGKFTNSQITRYYESYGTYQVPWIAMVQGKTTTIKATY